MKAKYLPKTNEGKFGLLVEECGEVLQAAGKSLRFGLMAFNPEVNIIERETNRDWLKRELIDLKNAIALVEEIL